MRALRISWGTGKVRGKREGEYKIDSLKTAENGMIPRNPANVRGGGKKHSGPLISRREECPRAGKVS